MGKTSRSLKACYSALAEAGLKRVAHLDGGAYGWYKANLPFYGEYDTSNLGAGRPMLRPAHLPRNKPAVNQAGNGRRLAVSDF
ncbi:hypothetical protein WJX72_012010 [[Myrmecia] bisecta]|uniref:Rhodanese domain-containing protein n=1 Tax=[Myrmecia] bisecta TaxID=41462 RepID=A0AAW1QU83_9CHLO